MYLMRHGEVAYFADPDSRVAAEDVVLTPTGREQARAAGRALATVQFDRVVTSGLPRTVETAQLVVEQLDRAPAEPAFVSDPDLEELRAGDADLIASDKLEDAYLMAFSPLAQRDTVFLGGESVGSLVERVGAALARLYDDPSWQTVLVVAHGGVNRAILSASLAGPGSFLGHVEQSHACINIVDGGPEFVVRAINTTPYDLMHLGPRSTSVERNLAEYLDFRRARKGRA